MMKTRNQRLLIRLLIISIAVMLVLLFIFSPTGGSNNDNNAAAINDSAENTNYDSSAFLETISDYEGYPFEYINNNIPEFKDDEIWKTSQEYLSLLDDLGRCGMAVSCIGIDAMPTVKRGQISDIHPTGWQDDRYDFIEGGNLYNRCHLVAYQLSGDDAIDRNLITGTRYLNAEGMLPFENAIAYYVRNTGNHVMYRVVPVFIGKEMVARGVHLEALSVEDEGIGISFNVFCYNVQPGVDIDYTTGHNSLSEDQSFLRKYESGMFSMAVVTSGPVYYTGDAYDGTRSINTPSQTMTYVLNMNTMRFHYEYCPSVDQMNPKNKKVEETTREELIERGFTPCGNCRP